MPMSDAELQKLNEVHTAVMEMKTALIGTPQIPGAIPELKSQVAQNTKDIASLQKWRWIVVGVGTGLGYVLKQFIHSVTVGTPLSGR